MDRLKLAIRRYQQILPKIAGRAKFPLKEIHTWLVEDVCGALREVIGRPSFREHASWPVFALHRGAATPEREAIERVDEALVQCARALAKFSDKKLVQRKLEELFPSVVAAGSGVIDASETHSVTVCLGGDDEIQDQLTRVYTVASRDWDDLVNVNDYFGPWPEFVQTPEGYVQRGDWIVPFNPELLPIGNFVLRCASKRIQMRYQLLNAIRSKLLRAHRLVGRDYRKDVEAIESTWKTLEDYVRAADKMLKGGKDAAIREACVTCTQVYATFGDDHDLGWLGLEADIIEHGRGTLRARLTQRQNVQMLDLIAAALRDLRVLVRDRRLGPIEEAIATGGLVLIESSHQVYWNRELIPEQFPGVSWRFLAALAKRAKHQATVGISDVYSDSTSFTVLSTAWGRLKEKLPPTLHRLVAPGDEARTSLQPRSASHPYFPLTAPWASSPFSDGRGQNSHMRRL